MNYLLEQEGSNEYGDEAPFSFPQDKSDYKNVNCTLPEYYKSRPGHCASNIDFPPEEK